jgi:hypothetical protein
LVFFCTPRGGGSLDALWHYPEIAESADYFPVTEAQRTSSRVSGLTNRSQFDILQSGFGWQGSYANRSIETA